MITIEELKKVFNVKLRSTGSLDAAFTKAVWVAYLKGIEEGRKQNETPTTRQPNNRSQ